MKLLLQYGESKKIREISDLSNLNTIINETFCLEPGSYFIQKFDREFEDFIDLEDMSNISDKDKIKILLLSQEKAGPNEISLDTSLTFSSDLVGVEERFEDVVIFPVHSKQWPLKIELPTEDFSKALVGDLMAERRLSWDRSRELIGHLANYAYSFKPYPSKIERLEICNALVMKYPYLRNTVGVGIGGWELKLLNKLKKIRQGDTSLEVVMNRQQLKIPGSNMPKHLNVNPKKGELNWSPDHIPGETEDSVRLHKQIMHSEFSKTEKYQDSNKIASLMSLTYSFRRQQINQKISVYDLKNEYPLFFQLNEQLDEFERLTAISIKDIFYEEVRNQGQELYQIFQRKKKSPEELVCLQNFEKECVDMPLSKKIEEQNSFGIFILPYLLREDIGSIYKLVQGEDDTPECQSSHPQIYFNESPILAEDFVIISEGLELIKTRSFNDAVGLLISFYYTLNFQYPPAAVNTLKFLQNSMLKIRGGSIPLKVQNLMNKIQIRTSF